MTSVDVKAKAELSLSADITFTGGTFFSLGGQAATCKAIGLSCSSEAAAASTSTSALLLNLYITAASAGNCSCYLIPLFMLNWTEL